MKSRSSTCIRLIPLLVALAVPIQFAAQDNQDQEPKHEHHHHRYKVIDIGTFGGPESYIVPFSEFGSHNPINRHGVTVGAAGTAISRTPKNNPFMCGGFDGYVELVNHALELQNGVVTDLGSLGGPDNCSVATSINARGEVTGQSEKGVVDPATGVNELRAVLWKDGEIFDLGTLGGNDSLAAGINNRGEVVGAALNVVADPSSIYDFQLFGSSNGTQTRAFLWKNGAMRDLGTLGGPDALGLFVNDRGQVAGYSYTNSTPNPDNGPFCAANIPTQHPFLWENGKMTDLGSLGGTCFYQLGALNDRGQVVGTSTLAGNMIFHPFLWTKPGPLQELRITLGGDCGTATAINDAGDVVGEADLQPPCGLPLFHAFLWKKGVMTDLGTVGGDTCSVAGSINSKDKIVGVSIQ
jgi:probable HAF family extracellular repeat protein